MIVRELVNRVLFTTQPGQIEKLNSQFSGLRKSALSITKGLGKGFAAAMAGAVHSVLDAEKSIANVEFFADGAKQAEQMLAIAEQLRKPFISEREALASLSILSKMNVETKDLGKSFNLLQDISVAAGSNLNIKQASEAFKDFVKTGESDSLESLGLIGKRIAEAFRKGNISSALGAASEQKRLEFLMDQADKRSERIAQLVANQQKTLTFSLNQNAVEMSDILLKLGKITTPALKELSDFSAETLKAIKNWDELWSGIKETADSLQSLIKFIRQDGITGILDKSINNLKKDLSDTFLGREPLDITPQQKQIAKNLADTARQERSVSKLSESFKMGATPRTARENLSIQATEAARSVTEKITERTRIIEKQTQTAIEPLQQQAVKLEINVNSKIQELTKDTQFISEVTNLFQSWLNRKAKNVSNTFATQ